MATAKRRHEDIGGEAGGDLGEEEDSDDEIEAGGGGAADLLSPPADKRVKLEHDFLPPIPPVHHPQGGGVGGGMPHPGLHHLM